MKTPKLYFLDTGLAAYLTKWNKPEVLEAGAMAGIAKQQINHKIKGKFFNACSIGIISIASSDICLSPPYIK